MNKTLLVGRLVADPELTKTSNGKSLLRINLAVKRRYKNASGEKIQTLSLWSFGRNRRNTVHPMLKRCPTCCRREIRNRNYVDKQEQKRYVTEVLVKTFDLLESRATVAMRQDSIESSALNLKEDELPF